MNFLSSGAMGDVIYQIPTIRSLQSRNAEPFSKANLYLQPDVADTIPSWAGTRQAVRMTSPQATSLIPLLTGQQGLSEVGIYSGQPIDYELDAFRNLQELDKSKGDIARYAAYAHQASPQTWKPWLKVKASPDLAGAILVNRTTRYRHPKISYSFLARRANVYFVGFQDEYAAFTRDCPGLPRIKAKDALELASWVKASKCVIGNQSFVFSLAEALKVSRLLEIFPQAPNVIIHGPKGWDAINQKLFQSIGEELIK